MIPAGLTMSYMAIAIGDALGTLLTGGSLKVDVYYGSMYGYEWALNAGGTTPTVFLVSGKRLNAAMYFANTNTSYVSFDSTTPVTWTKVRINGKVTLKASRTTEAYDSQALSPSGSGAYGYEFPGDILNGARSGTVPIEFY